jgi:hypothetical protein
MPDIIADTADIDDQIAVAKETFELIEQAAANSVLQRMIWWRNVFRIRKPD